MLPAFTKAYFPSFLRFSQAPRVPFLQLWVWALASRCYEKYCDLIHKNKEVIFFEA